jgi:hypothetical protein
LTAETPDLGSVLLPQMGTADFGFDTSVSFDFLSLRATPRIVTLGV